MVDTPNLLEGQVDKALARPLTITNLLEDQALVHRFIEDVAQAIFPPQEIAKRYSITPQDMLDLIRGNEEIRRRIQIRRAIWQSDDSIEARIRKYSGTVLLESLPATGAKLTDPSVPNSIALDYLKAYSRMAGVDGMPASAKDGSGVGGNQFTVNFHFSGGRVERVSTTVVDSQPAIADK
jgi:hypothetical protein